MSTLADDAAARWVEAARAVRVADEAARRNLALRRAGTELVGPCPVCGGRDRFAVNPAKNIWLCRRCGRGGDAIALVEHLDGADFLAACETLTGQAPPRGEGARLDAEAMAARQREAQARAEATQAAQEQYREAERRRVYAMWRAALPLACTPAADYLTLRGLPVPPTRALKCALDVPYFHGQEPDERGHNHPRVIHRGPAMLAAITDAAGTFRGLHITWIDLAQPKGKAEISDPDTGELLPAKKVRGSKKGNSILLLPAWGGIATTVYAAEGIETLLSVWAALVETGADLRETAFISAVDLGNLAGRAANTVAHPSLKVADKNGVMRRVLVPGPVPDLQSPALAIPEDCRELVLLGDGDSEPFFTRCAMARAQARHAAPGRDVRIAWAAPGMDFNDMWLARQAQPDGEA